MRKISPGTPVYIIWTKKHHFVELEGVLSYYHKSTPVFSTKTGDISGKDCFWIEKTRVKNSEDLSKYQKRIIPLQLHYAAVAREIGESFHPKIQYKKVMEMAEQKLEQIGKLKQFISKFGFDPTDDSYVEDILASNELERKWFKFMRENKNPVPNKDLVQIFNRDHNQNITTQDATKLTLKRMRYILGAQPSRLKGVNNSDKWKEDAIAFESKCSQRDNRMKNWSLSLNGNFPTVKTKKPIEFWPGNHLMQCIEKIPQIFLSPDCEYIRPGTILEVRGYDPKEKWIDLEFTPDIREKLTGTEEVKPDSTYAIVVHPNAIDVLEGIENLEPKRE